MANKGKLFLIPSPLGENPPIEVIPVPVIEKIKSIKTFVVEEIRTARRYLSSVGLKGHIDELDFHLLNEHSQPQDVSSMISLFNNGNDVGLISEAGLPAVADPGAKLVALCHNQDIEVVPFVGPSSLMMALMSSGLNGQSFAFCGYLPAKSDERRSAIKNIENISIKQNQTQIFIETPYRNDSMLADIISSCRNRTNVCIAVNITMPDAYIKTRTVAQWRKAMPEIGKRPCVFLILG